MTLPGFSVRLGGIGDALFVGGNDHPVKETGVACIQVRDPDESKRIFEALVACLERA